MTNQVGMKFEFRLEDTHQLVSGPVQIAEIRFGRFPLGITVRGAFGSTELEAWLDYPNGRQIISRAYASLKTFGTSSWAATRRRHRFSLHKAAESLSSDSSGFVRHRSDQTSKSFSHLLKAVSEREFPGESTVLTPLTNHSRLKHQGG
jgi:hypothetical protein